MKILHIPLSGALREIEIPDERAAEELRSMLNVREYNVMDLPGQHYGIVTVSYGRGDYPGQINRRASPLYAGWPTYNVYGDAYIAKLEEQEASHKILAGLSDDEISFFKEYIIRL